MARKNKAGGSGAKKGGPAKGKGVAAAKATANKSKKDKKLFKVAIPAIDKKKPKEVKGKLKKIKDLVTKKQEKTDSQLKDLQPSLVIKTPKAPSARITKKQQTPVNTKTASLKLSKLKF